MCLQYEIAKAKTLDELALEVNRRLKYDWLLNGGLIATGLKDFPFAQAMIGTATISNAIPSSNTSEWWRNKDN